MKNWINYRWNEGESVINNHQDYQDNFSLCIPCISIRLADFMFKSIKLNRN